MGETEPNGGVSDAAGGRASCGLAKRFALALIKNRAGATAIEYGLIVSLIFLVIVSSMTAFGNHATNVIDTASNAISGTL